MTIGGMVSVALSRIANTQLLVYRNWVAVSHCHSPNFARAKRSCEIEDPERGRRVASRRTLLGTLNFVLNFVEQNWRCPDFPPALGGRLLNAPLTL